MVGEVEVVCDQIVSLVPFHQKLLPAVVSQLPLPAPELLASGSQINWAANALPPLNSENATAAKNANRGKTAFRICRAGEMAIAPRHCGTGRRKYFACIRIQGSGRFRTSPTIKRSFDEAFFQRQVSWFKP